ncbi:TPA: hypothetical protein EYO12_04390 [Candidatus Saccharibacteria bacterium]|nr:hypothetical protein [Candidatus Saccharibacteria bacterium]HIO87726.1 hypothetical protein [Candidatus Saccharibacteria bacterium]
MSESTHNPTNVETSLKDVSDYFSQVSNSVITGSDKFPDGYDGIASELRGIRKRLQEDTEANGHDIAAYYSVFKQEKNLMNTVFGKEPKSTDFERFLGYFSDDKIATALTAEDAQGALHQDLLSTLDQARRDSQRYAAGKIISILQIQHGKDQAADLITDPGTERSEFDCAVREMLVHKTTIEAMMHKDITYEVGVSWGERQRVVQTWFENIVVSAYSMEPEEAQKYAFTVSRRGYAENIAQFISHMDHFGPKSVKALTTETGIYSLENYTVEQLERMVRLSDDPHALAEELSNHDVTVYMANALGDHNGVLGDGPGLFDSNGRTLFFEISSPTDIYRHMLRLEKVGIQPSTFVLAAHGAEGQLSISDRSSPERRRRFIATISGKQMVDAFNADHHESGDFGIAIRDSKSLGRLTEEFMQPSRAIDDPEEAQGKKRIIIKACRAATSTDSYNKAKDGTKVSLGEDSIVSVIARQICELGGDNVEVYGADTSIQMRKNESGSGVEYTALSKERIREHTDVVRAQVQDGATSYDSIDEILLTKKI